MIKTLFEMIAFGIHYYQQRQHLCIIHHSETLHTILFKIIPHFGMHFINFFLFTLVNICFAEFKGDIFPFYSWFSEISSHRLPCRDYT